jgi:hypothetical protein
MIDSSPEMLPPIALPPTAPADPPGAVGETGTSLCCGIRSGLLGLNCGTGGGASGGGTCAAAPETSANVSVTVAIANFLFIGLIFLRCPFSYARSRLLQDKRSIQAFAAIRTA